MPGINISEQTHVVSILPAVSISGGKLSQAFSMKNAAHVSLVLGFAVQGAAVPTAIIVNQCTNAAGAGATPLNSFRYYYQLLGSAGNDILNGAAQSLANGPAKPPNYTTSSAGITVFPTSVANLVYVIEIDAAELETLSAVPGPITEYPYVQLQLVDSGNATFASAFAVLSGSRFAADLQASATI
jgi:hypothetical protein